MTTLNKLPYNKFVIDTDTTPIFCDSYTEALEIVKTYFNDEVWRIL